MKVYSLLYKTANNLKTFIVNNKLDPAKQQLVIIHTDKLIKEDIAPISKLIQKLLPKANIIGCSVGGILYKGQSLNGETLISILDCNSSEIKTAVISIKDGENYKSPSALTNEILEQLGGGDDSFMFAYYTPNYPYMSQAVSLLNANAHSLRLIGGGAYSVKGDLYGTPSYVIHNSDTAEDSIVFAKLNGPNLFSTQVTVTGIRAVGRRYKVTKSSEHRIYEIDGQPARKWLNFMVGEEYLNKDPDIIHAIPLVRNGEGGLGLNFNCTLDELTKEPLGNDLFVFDEVREGEFVTAGFIDPNDTSAELEPFCNKLIDSPVEVLFGYSCLTRRNVLHNCAQWELRPFTATQIAGAFLAGELVYDGKACRYSNSAFTVAGLSEDNNAKINLNLTTIKDRDLLQFDNLPLVNYLFSTANAELKNEINDSRQKLAEQMVTDSATGLANLTKFMHDSETCGYNALCLISLKNESVIRVFHKKESYVYYIKSVADTCKQLLSDDYKIYRYNELSVIVASHVKDKQPFVEDLQNVLATLGKKKDKSHQAIYEMSIVFGEEDLLNRIELTYINLHKSDKYVLINDDNSKTLVKELQLLEVINDAISNNNVIPFYQGIVNNKNNKIEICESLMRLTDKDGKIYMPGDFLPVAKEYKLYDKLSYLMIERVLDEAPKHSFAVSINLNVSDVYNQETVNMIFEKLKKTPRPDKIIFEIVESEDITDYTYFKAFTDRIHSLGAKIAIDDFGSGYSNLMHILKIDLDYIKITGEIIKDICNDKTCRDFVNMISTLANVYKRKVIAEYVENESIQRRLKKYRVNYSQGYLFSRPGRLEDKT
ncbi:MAG: EAL domain-containing protein [Candidatus Coproplasma sp.]